MRPNFGITDIVRALPRGRRAGRCVRAVEQELAHRLRVRHAILTPSGRGGLFLLLHCLPPGRVCIPGYTCSAVAEAAQLAGRDVAFIEHRDNGVNLTANDIEGRLAPGDLFILTHQYGLASDVESLVHASTSHHALIIEDIAAALGGTSGGKPLGSFGKAAFGSFDVSKLVNVPLKGGFVATNDDKLATILRAKAAQVFSPMSRTRMLTLALQGCILSILTRTPLYGVFHWLNFSRRGRTTAEDGKLADAPNHLYTDAFAEWQAAIALPQLQGLDALIRVRARIVWHLEARCRKHSLFDIEPLAAEVPGTTIRFPVYAKGNKLALYRRLAALGVDCNFSFTTLATPRSFAASWQRASCVLNLPYYPTLSERELRLLDRALSHLARSVPC